MRNDKSQRMTRKTLGKQLSSKYSIVGGTENPSSLGCIFYMLEGGETGTCFTGKVFHEGHDGMMHGGLIESVLDEVMGRSTYSLQNAPEGECSFVTGEMTTRFYRPVKTGEFMRAIAKVESINGRQVFTKGELLDSENHIMAEADGIYVKVDAIKENLIDANGKNAEKETCFDILPIDENDPQKL